MQSTWRLRAARSAQALGRMFGAREVPDDSIWSALLGIFLWMTVVGLFATCFALLARYGTRIGIDLGAAWGVGEPIGELVAMVAGSVLFVVAIVYAGISIAVALLKPYFTERLLRQMYLDNLGCRFYRFKPARWCKALDRIHNRLFDALFVGRAAA